MLRRIGHTFLLGAFALGSSVTIAVVSTAQANALPVGTINLQNEFDIYQRPSGTQDSPLGFHVDIKKSKHFDDESAISFEGFVHTSTMNGQLRDGVIRVGSLSFIIDWNDGKTGIYQGDRYFDGYLRGHSIRQGHSGQNAEWWSGSNSWTATTY